jgi:prophage regulatory protein
LGILEFFQFALSCLLHCFQLGKVFTLLQVMHAMKTPQKIIRLPETIKKTGLSRSTIYSLEAQGNFPQKIKLSDRAMGHLESEVDDWIAKKAAARA